MQTFASSRDAKEFIVSRIVVEAQRQNVPLSEVERKMLYFSETAWTLPDIAAVSGTFDRKCDQKEYVNLVRDFCVYARADARSDFDAWNEAVRTLSHEDHYVRSLIGVATPPVRPRGDLVRLLVIASTIVGVFVAIAFWKMTAR
ncbi:MAG: hypothetical protein ACLPWF_32085 [Bryobacteraceae bacterium]